MRLYAKNSTILVVDDSPENINILTGILKPYYKVKIATSGETAIAITRSDYPPDLILLDIAMPGKNGYEVCAEIKTHLPTRRIPIIFCTALSDMEDEAKGFDAGCIDYITKPVSPPIVLARVRTHLQLYSLNNSLEQKIKERTEEVCRTRLSIIRCLGRAAEHNDNETGFHVLRMAHFCKLLALKAGFSEDDAELLFQAAPMHDVGKIAIPDSILKKQGPLSDDEWKTMKRHVELGVEILEDEDDDSELMQMARCVAGGHHEKWDGSGYPLGLAGEDIPITARIATIADVFDALTTERPYKEAWSTDRALRYLRENTGTHFDPTLISHFEQILPEVLAIKSRYADTEAA